MFKNTKYMKKILVIIIPLMVLSQKLSAWSRTEHDAIAYIAECNLKPEVKKRIESYLGGHSIVYFASWMDDYRKTPEFLFTDNWHMGTVDENFQSTEVVHSSRGDCVPALEEAIKKLENYKSLSDSIVALNIKYVIHLTGDMHCPVHINYATYRSFFNVNYNGTELSYHSVWDYAMLRHAHTWSYTEYQHQLDRCSAEDKKQIMQGTPREWFGQSAKDCVIIYEWAKAGDNLGVDFMNKAHVLGENQILKAGYRLAYLLNKLFE